MSEDDMLKCLIAFVLGFLVHRMMRGNGLSIGEGGSCPKWDPDKPHGYGYGQYKQINRLKCVDQTIDWSVTLPEEDSAWVDVKLEAGQREPGGRIVDEDKKKFPKRPIKCCPAGSCFAEDEGLDSENYLQYYSYCVPKT